MGEVLFQEKAALPTTLDEAIAQVLAPQTKRWSEISHAEWRERRGIASTWVSCRYCFAAVGEPCKTASGKPVRGRSGDDPSHAERWDSIHRMQAKAWRWVLLDDDPRMKLSRGDVLICIPYWLDGAKVTVLYRESDGFDPNCNQYRHDVAKIWGPIGIPDPEKLRQFEEREKERYEHAYV